MSFSLEVNPWRGIQLNQKVITLMVDNFIFYYVNGYYINGRHVITLMVITLMVDFITLMGVITLMGDMLLH